MNPEKFDSELFFNRPKPLVPTFETDSNYGNTNHADIDDGYAEELLSNLKEEVADQIIQNSRARNFIDAQGFYCDLRAIEIMLKELGPAGETSLLKVQPVIEGKRATYPRMETVRRSA